MSIKDKVAQSKGYPSWEEMYDWISREGENPVVVAQLIEAASFEVCIETVKSLVRENCDDHTPFRGPCVSCNRYDNFDALPRPEIVIQELESLRA